MDEYPDDYPADEETDGRPRDPAIDAAIMRLRDFFDQSSRRLFYSTQIETSLEREFFHWITGKGLLELARSQDIQRAPIDVQGKTVNFYAHRSHRYWKREQQDISNLLERIFQPEFTHAVGRHGVRWSPEFGPVNKV
jgi:hypothetical protein